MKRDAQFNAYAALLTPKQFEALCGSIKLSQPSPGVRQTDSFFDLSVFIKTRAVVAHDQRQGAVLAAGLQFNTAGPGAWLDPMANCIFNERLQNKIRDLRSERVGGDIQLHGEPAAEPDLFDGEVELQQIQLLPQSHLRATNR